MTALPQGGPSKARAPIIDHVRGYLVLDADRIEEDPANANVHSAAQKTAAKTLLQRVGLVSGLVVWVPDDVERARLVALPGPDGFELWASSFTGKVRLSDGHMRRGLLRGRKVRVQVNDYGPEDAALVLATYDPMGALRARDEALGAALVATLHAGDAALAAALLPAPPAVVAGAPDLDDGPAVDPTDEILAKWAALGCVSGSLWEIPSADGQRVHRVLCGDARKPEDVARLMDGQRAALGQHDPPYGVNAVQRSGSVSGEKHGKRRKNIFREIVGDAALFDPAHLLDSGDRVVLWGANNFPAHLTASAEWVVWLKIGDDCAENDFSSCELAFVTAPPDRVGHVRRIVHLTKHFDGNAEKGEKRLHPTTKPVAVIAQPIEWWTKPGDIVTDWYCGSGTVGVACEKTGRTAYLMEITSRYVAVTLERLTRAGLTPRLVAP